MSGFQEFDDYISRHNVAKEDHPEAFAQFLADATRAPVIAGPVGEAPSVVAIPECSNPYCDDGWVAWGNNESGGAPAIPCRVCKQAWA